MEYGHEQAVADGVNVDYDVYRIRTAVTEHGGRRSSRLLRWIRGRAHARRALGTLDEDLTYDPNQLDRDVVRRGPDPHHHPHVSRQAVPEIFPGRTEVPKTLIFAKDDSHAEDIVEIVREEFAQGQRLLPEDHLSNDGRRRPNDLIATPSATATTRALPSPST